VGKGNGVGELFFPRPETGHAPDEVSVPVGSGVADFAGVFAKPGTLACGASPRKVSSTQRKNPVQDGH